MHLQYSGHLLSASCVCLILTYEVGTIIKSFKDEKLEAQQKLSNSSIQYYTACK